MKNKRLHHHYVISRNGQPALALLATYTQKWLALKGLRLTEEIPRQKLERDVSLPREVVQIYSVHHLGWGHLSVGRNRAAISLDTIKRYAAN